jgi:O-methyltransferase
MVQDVRMRWTGTDLAMTADGFYKQLLADTVEYLASAQTGSAAIIGNSDIARQLTLDLDEAGLSDRLKGFYQTSGSGNTIQAAIASVPLRELKNASLDVLVVAADSDKETHLLAAAPFVVGTPKVIIAGYGHFDFHDPVYYDLTSSLDEPSLANGYPHSRIHLYQCLSNAARLGLQGIVVEFGMFRGGTTMFLSRVIEQLGQEWPVLGFDTFSGFPPKSNLLDMYDHEDLSAVNVGEVKDYLAGRRVEIIPGDIRRSVSRLNCEPIVMGFVDTDNFTPASAAIEGIVNHVVPGGAIVFDHLTGVDRFRYTLGERLAAKCLFDDPRYFNLHGTGVFIRQPTSFESPKVPS